METTTKTDKKKKTIIWTSIGVLLLLLIAVIVLFLCGAFSHTPVLTVETPQKIVEGSTETITIDVTISNLGDAIYPAMSASILFDPSRLEFLGVSEGNVFISNDEDAAGIAQKLPDWGYNTAKCNETGRINVIYVDMTGGKYAFCKELLRSEHNVLMRLNFRLRGSARAGDVLELIVEDAVFAASDETLSHSMVQDTLKTRNGRIVIGKQI